MAVFLRVGRVGADRVARPYGVGRRGRRPLQREALSLRTSDRVTGVAIRFPVAALVIQGGQSRPPLQRDGFPRRSVPQGHLLRGADWLGMTGNGTSRTPSPTHCVIARSTPRALASRRALARNDRERDVVPQGHLFRCAPLQDAVPYEMTGGRVHITDGGDDLRFCPCVGSCRF